MSRSQFCPASITPCFHIALHSLSPCCTQMPCRLLYMLISFYPIIVSRRKVAFLNSHYRNKISESYDAWKYLKEYNDFIPPFLVLHTSPLLPSLLTLFLVKHLVIDTSRGIQTQTFLYSYWFPVGKTDARVLFQWSEAEIMKRGTKHYGIQRMGEDSSASRGLKTYFNGSFATFMTSKSSS